MDAITAVINSVIEAKLATHEAPLQAKITTLLAENAALRAELSAEQAKNAAREARITKPHKQYCGNTDYKVLIGKDWIWRCTKGVFYGTVKEDAAGHAWFYCEQEGPIERSNDASDKEVQSAGRKEQPGCQCMDQDPRYGGHRNTHPQLHPCAKRISVPPPHKPHKTKKEKEKDPFFNVDRTL